MAHHLVFQAVVLGVHTAGQHQYAVRQLGLVGFAPPHDRLLVLQVAPVFPQLTEFRVVDDLELFCAAQGVEVGQDQRGPGRPGR